MHATFFNRKILIRTAWVLAVVPIGVFGGCQGKRLFAPMASRSAMDGSPPSMHGSKLANFGNQSRFGHRSDNGVQVTSENALPETDLAPVEQRLATVKSTNAPTTNPTSPQTLARPASNTSGQTPNPVPASHVTKPASPEADRTARNQTQSQRHDHAPARSEPAFEIPAEYEGVDVSALMKALQDAPPEVQKAAIGRLIAMSRKRAQPTQQPRSIEQTLAASMDSLPTLPDEVIDRGLNPTRLAASHTETRHPRFDSVAQAQTAPHAIVEPVAAASNPAEPKVANPTFHQVTFSDQDSVQTVAAEEEQSDQSHITQAVMEQPADMPPQPTIEKVVAVETPAAHAPAAKPADSLSDAELFDALVSRLQTKVEGENESQRHRRTVMTRHLMVLAGDPDRAVEKIEGLSNEEEEFLRHQLLGLWTIIDPNGHPVPSRRFSSALPEMRKATGYLAAASDSLEVRGLQFCTEIEAYGEVTPFPDRRFEPGQEVILYCEVENFIAANLDGGFETRLQGSYDLLDSNGKRVSSQSLPEDRQVSRNHLRDYFVAYQMYLPDAIDSGRYQLRLTMEDVHGKKYGQSTIDFEIKR